MKKGFDRMFLNTIESILSDNWPVLVIFIVTLVLVRFFYLRTHREKLSFYREFLMIISICYIFLLFQLLTKVEMNSNSGFNIVPLFGNIMAFVLFGLIVSCYIKPKTVFPPMIISALVSVTVEFVQLNIGRSFDVEDIILNVTGGVIGFLLYIGLTAIKNHLPKIFQRDGIYNLICLVLIVVIIFYILSVVGVINI